MNKILVINGSDRHGGFTDQAMELMVDQLRGDGAEVDIVLLREYPIEFCLNCRECTQQPGDAPGKCVQKDGMAALVDKLEAADGFIFAAPTNFGSVTALFKRFMERLIVYGYWPWGMHWPHFRKEKAVKKPTVLITSCAAPGLLGRLGFSTQKQLKQAASTVGGKVVGVLSSGMVSDERVPQLSEKVTSKARLLAKRLS